MQELKVGAGRFVVGAKAIQNLKREMQYFGKKALIIGGPSSVDKVAECVDRTSWESYIGIPVSAPSDGQRITARL